ncbi:MAG TPA: outer membrane protein assembly factor BamD [Myxococcota bacterium]|nr:outer membrane protein assembly factor BamD [Myxococcota bacterium]
MSLRPLLLALLLSGCAAFHKKPTGPMTIASTGRPPQEIYDHAMTMMKRGLYDKALADLQELRNDHRDDPLSVRAQLAIADMQFQKGEYEEARTAYEEFATYHPRHPDMDYVTWRIGLCIWKRAPKVAGRDQAGTRSAVNTWTGFERRYPESEYIDDAARLQARGVDRLASKELFVARFYQKREAWLAVEGRARGLLWRYPDSSHAAEAQAMLAVALHETGRPDEAKQWRDTLATDHPESSMITRVDRTLARDPGTPPEDEIFVRPYRVPGMDAAQQAARR